MLRDFLKDQRGATAIEYSLIASAIALAVLAAVQNIGSTLNTTFSNLTTAIK